MLMSQTAHTALANGQAKVEKRLARWLLMAHDRVDGDELHLTHDFLAVMLSMRRAGRLRNTLGCRSDRKRIPCLEILRAARCGVGPARRTPRG